MNVLVIPEHPRYDRYILEPLISAMMSEIGKSVNITMCIDPVLNGIDQALRFERQLEIVERYKYRIGLFILCVDRDSKQVRAAQLEKLAKAVNDKLAGKSKFLTIQAKEAVEVWLLAGHDLPSELKWDEIRNARFPKPYFEDFVRYRKIKNDIGGGRNILGKEAAKRYSRIKQKCDEIADLEQRVRAWIENPRIEESNL